MELEPGFDLFLAVLSLLVWLIFSTLLPPSQQSSQPFAVEPPTSSSRRPWVSDLQPPSLRSFTLHRPLLFASPLQILLRLQFWRYHRDHLVSIYILVKALTPLETARAPNAAQRFCSADPRAFNTAPITSLPPSSELSCFDLRRQKRICLIRPFTRRQKFRRGLSHALHAPQGHLLTSSLTSSDYVILMMSSYYAILLTSS